MLCIVEMDLYSKINAFSCFSRFSEFWLQKGQRNINAKQTNILF